MRSAVPPPASISSLPPVQPGPPSVTAAVPPPTSPLLEVPRATSWKPLVAERQWKYIVLHHTASTQGSVESIHESHLQRKDKSGKPWLGIGYHFVIGNGKGMPDGQIEPTFRWNQQLHGAHAGSQDPEYNQLGIGIVLVGNFEKSSPTDAQLASVKKLVRTLKSQYKIPSSKVIGHRDIRSTECPGSLFPLADIARDDSSRQLSNSGPQPGFGVQVAGQIEAFTR
ncbi:MAG TPA: peptidoglycan recognition family protein [Planctomycetaceae bacterium]|nr:peptidoglycan recognition family protein [Planctomycetaceae bacterium]